MVNTHSNTDMASRPTNLGASLIAGNDNNYGLGHNCDSSGRLMHHVETSQQGLNPAVPDETVNLVDGSDGMNLSATSDSVFEGFGSSEANNLPMNSLMARLLEDTLGKYMSKMDENNKKLEVALDTSQAKVCEGIKALENKFDIYKKELDSKVSIIENIQLGLVNKLTELGPKVTSHSADILALQQANWMLLQR